MFKRICSLVQKLTPSPLSSLDFEPAVQPLTFCRLAPETKDYLCLGPRVLQKTPWNLVFLADKPLELVFSLDYVF